MDATMITPNSRVITFLSKFITMSWVQWSAETVFYLLGALGLCTTTRVQNIFSPFSCKSMVGRSGQYIKWSPGDKCHIVIVRDGSGLSGNLVGLCHRHEVYKFQLCKRQLLSALEFESKFQICDYLLKYIKIKEYSLVMMYYSLFHANAIFRYTIRLGSYCSDTRFSVPKRNVVIVIQY